MTKEQIVNLILNEQNRIHTLGLRSLRKPLLAVQKLLVKAKSESDIPEILHSQDDAIIETILNTVVLADLTGRERTRIRLKLNGIKQQNKQNQNTLERLSMSMLTNALVSVGNRSNTGSLIPTLTRLYKPRVQSQLAISQAHTERLLRSTIKESIAKGDHIKAGVARLKEATETAGISFSQPHVYENMLRTELAIAYEAGRQKELQAPEIQSILWGYEYSAVGDARTRPSHDALDGLILPKDAPEWGSITTPNGYNCRCTIIEVFNDEAPPQAGAVDPNGGADAGFEFNPVQLLNGQ